jgi:hypothetical protein
MLEVSVSLKRNPWDHSVPDSMLHNLLYKVGESRAKHVEKQYDNGNGEWPRGSLGLALMVPRAPRSLPAADALLATIAIGPECERFVINAAAKAGYHHEHGVPGGYGVYMDLAASADGDFCYGFSAEVDGMIAGASAQNEIQDACEAAHAAATFLYFIRRQRGAWMGGQEERPHWFCNIDQPGETYQAMVAQPAIYP